MAPFKKKAEDLPIGASAYLLGLDSDGKGVKQAAGSYATSQQGSLANSAVQPGDLGSAAYVSTSAFATSAQGGKADTALQSVNIGVEVQAYSANLDEVAAVTPGAAGLAIIADGTEAEVRDYIDPLKAFHADGTTSDTANFTALEGLYSGREIDLRGGVYLVSTTPTGNRYFNGHFQVNGSGEGGGNIRQEAPRLKTSVSRKIAHGDYHSNWPQGKNNLVYNGTMFAVWMEGGGHEAIDTHIRVARSTDNGSTWRAFERLFQVSGAARSCWAACVVHGRLVLVVRIHSGAHNDSTITGATIYSRRIGERRERKLNPITGVDASSMEIRATNGSATYRVANCPKHGVLVGSVVNIANVGATVGGRTVSGDYTVTAVGVDYFEFTHPSGAATSTETATSDFTLRFKEEAAFVEHLFGGDTIYTEVTQFPSTTRDGSNAFYFHGAAEIKSDTSGAMYLGVTGGAAGPAIAKVTGLISGTPSLAKMKEINSSTGRAEPGFDVASDGTLIGFLRTNDPTLVGGLFYSADDIGTITHRLNVSGAGNDFRYAPFGVSVDLSDDTVYAVVTGNRVRGTAGSTTAGEVPVYMLKGALADIINDGWTALAITQFKNVWFANDSQGDTGNGVGIGASAIQDGILHVFMATETPAMRNDVFGSPDIEYDRIYLAPPTTEEFASRKVASIAQGEPHIQYAGRFVGYGAAHLIAEVTTAGVVNWGHGLTVAGGAIGVCTVTLNKAIAGARYVPEVRSVGNGNVIATISNTPTETSFEVAVRNITTGALTAGTVRIVIFADYQPYRTDWGGDIA